MNFEKTKLKITTSPSADANIASSWTYPLSTPKAANSNRLSIATKITSTKKIVSGTSRFGVLTHRPSYTESERTEYLAKCQNFKALYEAGLQR